MADELNTPSHPWYERRNHFRDPRNAASRKYIDPTKIPGYDTTGPDRLTDPTYSPPAPIKIGTSYSFTQGTYAPSGGGTVNVVTRWLVGGVPHPSPYTPVDGDDLQSMILDEVATETGGTNDGSTTYSRRVGTITYPAPTIVSQPPDVAYEEQTGLHIENMAPYVTGSNLTWSGTNPTGVAIDTLTGVVVVDSNVLPLGITGIQAIAKNSGGTAELNYNMLITEAGISPIIDSLVVLGTGDISFNTDTGSGAAYVVFSDDPNPSASDVVNGVGDVADNWQITGAGGNSGSIDLSSLDGQQKYCSVAHVAATGASNVLTEQVEIGSAVWTPADLYGSGEDGSYTLYTDNANLFEESTGETPATAGSPIGLALDLSQGDPVEEIVNGTFDTDLTGWDAPNGDVTWDASQRARVFCPSGTNRPINQVITPPVGALMICTFEIETVLQTVRAEVNDSLVPGFANIDTGTYSFTYISTGNDKITFRRQTSVGDSEFLLDNVSYRSAAGNHAIQATDTARLQDWQTGGVQIDRVDDLLQITAPVGGWQGSMVIGTDIGCFSADIDIPEGTFELCGQRFPMVADSSRLVGAVIIDRVLTAQEITDTIDYFVAQGAAQSYATFAGIAGSFFRTPSPEYKEIHITFGPSVKSPANLARTAVNITRWDISSWDLTGTDLSFSYAWQQNYALTSFVGASVLSDNNIGSTSTNYTNAWQQCALDQTSVDEILVAIEAAGTSNGTLGMDGGTSAGPSYAGGGGQARDALVARGWTVNANPDSDQPPATYTPNWVNTGPSLVRGAGFEVPNGKQFTFSMWFETPTVAGAQRFSQLRGGNGIDFETNNSGKLYIHFENPSSASIYEATSTNAVFAVDTPHHVYISVDTLVAPYITVKVDGVDVPMTENSNTLADGDDVKMAGDLIFLSAHNNLNPLQGSVTDLIFDNSIIDYATLHDAGAPSDQSARIGVVQYFFGDTMTADERDGNANEGWNDTGPSDFNLGISAINTGIFTGGFTDA